MTALTSTQQQQVLAKIEADYQVAELALAKSFPRPKVEFTLRGKAAGMAHLQLNKLRFNPVLLTENFDTFIEHVIPHEISHLLCFRLFGKVKPHGREWQHIMYNVFKQAPKTTHQLDISSVQGKQFDYQCECGVVTLSIRRHNKVIRGEMQYRCRRCGHTLQAVTNHQAMISAAKID
ncbi:SprT family zinc-dependent metalloprotease [Shewanella intestini]|uniref:SprT family zinc-dependent metalloprotease n=1 Tax=Shewanella TaxID=22 RepID=UPI002B26D449|nr:SprT family zinc-dependent metalloprotease [Shewanella sp. XMDDZSB0408]